MKDHETFTITVESLPHQPGEPDAIVRLRQWLKLGLRGFKLRCVLAEMADVQVNEQEATR